MRIGSCVEVLQASLYTRKSMFGSKCGGWEHCFQHNAVDDHHVHHVVDLIIDEVIYSILLLLGFMSTST